MACPRCMEASGLCVDCEEMLFGDYAQDERLIARCFNHPCQKPIGHAGRCSSVGFVGIEKK